MAQNSIICENCGHEEHSKNPFCSNCGKLLDTAGYTSKDIYQQYEQRIMRMVENLKNHPHYDIVWDETLDLYAAKAEKFQSILRTGILDIDKDPIDKRFEDFLESCRHPEFQIAFVGTIKTGKSTLINALLGHNYASTSVNPETASLTKFRSSEKDYINVTFYSHDEWKKLYNSAKDNENRFMIKYKELNAEKEKNKWIGHEIFHRDLSNADVEKELYQWSSAESPQHFFVKEIEVGISSLPQDFPKQVVFVDTPGLNDPIAYRSDISKQYIKKANAVFVCVEARKLEDSERKTISSVFSFLAHEKSKVFIVATHWDALNYPEQDWAKRRPDIAKSLTGSGFYDSSEMADANILHSAALIHNLCRDYEKEDKSNLLPLTRFAPSVGINPFSLTNTDIRKLDEYSNIQHIHDIIRERLVKNYSRLLYGDLKREYDEILRLLRRNVEDQQTEYQEHIDAAGKDLAEIIHKYEQKKRDAEEIQKSRDQLNGILDSVRKMTENRIAEYQKALKKAYEK